MRILTFCLVILLCYSSVLSSESDGSQVEVMEKWTAYKLQHNKTYDESEDATRFETFKETLAKIEEHNAKYERKETTFKMGLNHMSDWNTDEKAKLHGTRPNPPPRQDQK